MAFSSLPLYPDPSNWQQQQNDHIIASSGTNNFFPPLQTAAPPLSPQPRGAWSVRPGSMSERARLANIPLPETALKCPRCDSTNTKFCYFNNYSLSQPRHFCKTCRRYWTRGGALRTVPVGGGCRHNKRSKSSASKSSPGSSDRQTITSTSTNTVSTNCATANFLGLNPPFRFMSPLTQVTANYTCGMGLNYTGVETGEMNFHWSGGGGIEHWQEQQFPLFGGLNTSPTGMYQFRGGESVFLGSEVSQAGRPKLSSSLLSQLASVKMEGNPDLNLSRELLGGIQGNEEWN